MLEALTPIWFTIPTTARRLRERIEKVLDFALPDDVVNPARWKGCIEKRLPPPRRSRKHHAALPFEDAPAFAARLSAHSGVSARVVEVVMLTAVRLSEAVNAEWSQIDWEAEVWIVPPENTKTGGKTNKPHRVPLVGRALEVFKGMRAYVGPGSSYVFPGRSLNQPVSPEALRYFVRELRKEVGFDFTIHGLRGTFSTWRGEATNFPPELVEFALDHLVGTEVARAYNHGDALDRRRPLMVAWDEYCAGKPQNEPANVTPFRSRYA